MISVISACRNEAGHIRPLLDCVLSQESPGEDWEFVIADGMSTDGTREILNDYQRQYRGRIRAIDNPGRYVSSGLNAAIRETRGRIVLRMDAHTVYAADYLRTCTEILEETGADNVGGPARTQTNGWLHDAIAAAYHSPFSCGGARFHMPEFEGWVDTVTYGCWRRETLDALGLFDEDMIRNQDDELNLRLVRAGGKIWQSPRIVSWYSPRTTLPALFRQYFQYGFWKVAVIRKHRVPARVQHLVPGVFVSLQLLLPLIALAAALTGAAVPFRAAAAAYIAMNLLYFTGVVLASVRIGSNRWSLLPVMPLVFATYHTSYGLGFVWGCITFFLRKHQGTRLGRLATDLTR